MALIITTQDIAMGCFNIIKNVIFRKIRIKILNRGAFLPKIENMIEEKPKTKRTKKTAQKTNELPHLKDVILNCLDENKAEDVLFIDLIGKSSIADAMVIATGRSNRHVAALAQYLIEKLKDEGHGKVKAEGLTNADWVLLDAGDIIVHIFKPEVREFYQIERIWVGDSKHLLGQN